MRVWSIEVRGFRNLAACRLPLVPGITLIHGPNGAGKTNLLEAAHFGLTARSCRTRNAREMVAFDADLARVGLELRGNTGEEVRLLASVTRGGERRRQITPQTAAPGVAVSVFLPDRLELIKGPPGGRRRQLDRLVASLWPARAGLRASYGRALAQRNALIGRVRAGAAPEDGLDAWDAELAAEGIALMAARDEAVAALREPFRGAASDLGVEPADVRYRPRSAAGSPAELVTELEQHREADLARGYSGHGPHMDELELSLSGRQVRRFGSQGQQRMVLLALLFGERAALEAAGAPAPPMLLDDVMSELDPGHRRLLAHRLEGNEQAIVTATEPGQIPAECAHATVEVAGGRIGEALSRAA